ncbi:MAG: hypothetical protein NVS2B7_33760 [Herpetosiphon sp.]
MNIKTDTMKPQATTTSRFRQTRLTPLGKITVIALLVNAVIFISIFVATGEQHSIPMFVVHLVLAVIVATGFRWPPALAALVCGPLLAMVAPYIHDQVAHPASPFALGRNELMNAAWLVVVVAGIAATVQNYRRPLAERTLAKGSYPALLALATFIVGGTVTTAVQPRAAATGISPDAVAALPRFGMKDTAFEQKEITAKVGDIVTLQLVNGDTTIHYLDIDELNVHAQVLAGKTNVALFRPTAPGTYTYYCHPHGNKAAGTGMVGKLVVAP